MYIGTNDVRLPGFAVAAFEDRLDAALAFVAERCDRTLTATIPLRMGRPANPPLVEACNGAIERAAARHGALVLDLRDFGGRRVMMADHVHPTALGQVEIAERALALLARDEMEVRVRPSALIAYSISWRERLRSELTYAHRSAKESVRAWRASRTVQS